MIKGAVNGKAEERALKKWRKTAESAAEISSQTERKAQELERDAEKMKKAQYMEDKVGEIYDGVISGVTSFGIYVQLPNTVEGMIRLDRLKDDDYDYEEGKYRVIGRRTHRVYALGDQIRIVVLRASAGDRQIDFALVREKKNGETDPYAEKNVIE